MSIIAALVGPIEYWWDTPEDPHRFDSQQAVEYRAWRVELRDFLAKHGLLVYSPHLAFFGPWDERAQAHNDSVITICDIVFNMRPYGIPGKGTDHELELAEHLSKVIVNTPPGYDLDGLGLWIKNVLPGYLDRELVGLV